ncbi:MAG: leucyl aminopeptidase [Nitrospira sp.]|nr:leucyl aminopeptidase [Nitrospira sp.]
MMETKLIVKKGNLLREWVDAIIVGIYEDGTELSPVAREINQLTNGAIDNVLERKGFTGKQEQLELINTGGVIAAPYVFLCGLGKVDKTGIEQIRQAMGRASLRARDKGFKTIATTTGAFNYKLENASVKDVARAITEGAYLALYRFLKYKAKDISNSKNIEELRVAEETDTLKDAEKGAAQGRIIAESVNCARDLINHPANDMTPAILAEAAEKMAKTQKMTCKVLSKPQIEKLGMGAFLGVAKGSQEPPKFIILEYNGGKKGDKPVVLVGKSITFDSGGISIKPSEGMGKMKYDMAGGAITLGVLRAAAMLKIPVNLVGLLPATENMPSGTASRPGDVLRTMNGLTIEVISTDAEGRLILADALCYAAKYKPKCIIDIATLTGACVIALGNHATGMLGNDKELKERIVKAGEAVWERVWEMPLWDDYFEQIKSPIADMKNTGGREGGVMIAAALLSKFVEDYPWVHLDIAGVAWNDKEKAYMPVGASGIGVRLLVQFLLDSI